MSGSLFAKTTSQIAYSATTTLLSRLPPQLGASSSPSPVVSHLSRPEAGPISVRAHEVWYNTLTAQPGLRIWLWLKPLHPRPQLDLPGPGAAGLRDEVKIGLRDRLGIEHAVGLVGGLRSARAADAAVDHHMGDVDAGGRKLARHALGKPAQRELAHGEGRRLCIAFHARGRAGEDDGAALVRQHAPRRLLPDQKGAVGGDRERLLDICRIELEQRPAGAKAC